MPNPWLRALWLCLLLLGAPWAWAAQKDDGARVIHVLVALCDNQYQGIVPVPSHLGDGDDLKGNLYWGAAYGVKTYFQRSKSWQRVAQIRDPAPGILERVVFKKSGENTYLVADAYRGREIRKATTDFLAFSAGRQGATLSVGAAGQPPLALGIGGNAGLIVYVGHDGLMDFSVSPYPTPADGKARDVAILACLSQRYFHDAIKSTGARPLLWTTNLMAPEAYALQAIADGWSRQDSAEAIRQATARSYAAAQKISVKAALRLFASGW